MFSIEFKHDVVNGVRLFVFAGRKYSLAVFGWRVYFGRRVLERRA